MADFPLKKFLYGLGIFLVTVVALWGVWQLVGTQSEPASTKIFTIPLSEKEWSQGNKAAKATLVEFSDFQCPACKSYAPLVKQLMESHKTDVYFVYKHFPLSVHEHSVEAARAAEAAGLQDKFFEMHDILFEKQDEWENSKKAVDLFAGYAQKLKLDLPKFKTDMNSAVVKAAVQDDLDAGNKVTVDATPTFYLNGRKLESPRSLEEFEKVIQEALK